MMADQVNRKKFKNLKSFKIYQKMKRFYKDTRICPRPKSFLRSRRSFIKIFTRSNSSEDYR